MKRIKNRVIANPFSEQPIPFGYGPMKSNGKMLYEVNEYDGRPLLDPSGNPIPKQITRDLTTALAMRGFVASLSSTREDALTMDDSHRAHSILTALKRFKLFDVEFYGGAPKTIVLDEDDYKWLVEKYKKRGVELQGILAQTWLDAFQDEEKLEEPPVDESNENGAKKKKETTRAGA